MPRPTIPPQVLAARGVPIRLIDDTEVRICYTFHSLLTLEEKHGGLSGAMEALANPTAAQFGSIVGLLAAGLEHELYDVTEPADAAAGFQGRLTRERLDDPETLSFLLDPMEIHTYAAAMGEAFKRSFPTAAAGEGGEEQDPPEGSPGLSGSTSEPSTSGGATRSSGA
jgi:hypothetical protein